MAFILHTIDELIHHAAEVELLRDLYRAAQPGDPVVSALLLGLVGSVIGGWMASGEPMTLTHYRHRTTNGTLHAPRGEQ